LFDGDASDLRLDDAAEREDVEGLGLYFDDTIIAQSESESTPGHESEGISHLFGDGDLSLAGHDCGGHDISWR